MGCLPVCTPISNSREDIGVTAPCARGGRPGEVATANATPNACSNSGVRLRLPAGADGGRDRRRATAAIAIRRRLRWTWRTPPAPGRRLADAAQEHDGPEPGARGVLRRDSRRLLEDDVRRRHARPDDDAAHRRGRRAAGRAAGRARARRARGVDQRPGPRGVRRSPVPHLRPLDPGRAGHAGAVAGVQTRCRQHGLSQGLPDQLSRAGWHAVDSTVDCA